MTYRGKTAAPILYTLICHRAQQQMRTIATWASKSRRRSLSSPSIHFKKCHLIESHFQHDSSAVMQSEHSHLTLLFASMAREGRENELLICKWIGSH